MYVSGFRLFIPLVLVITLQAAETDALAIDANIQARHLPFGTILNPFLTANGTVTGYTRCGDSALWTGNYLAAEAFRWRVTGSDQALANVRGALAGLTLLTDVTGTDLLARCAIPADSPYTAGIEREEAGNGIYNATLYGKPWVWVGHTSRDQYSGVFFGLGTAYDLVSDPAIRAGIASLATRLLNHLLQSSWNIVMPDGTISTTFLIRPDQELTLLQIGQHLNPQQFASEYAQSAANLASLAEVPLSLDASNDRSSYFKFNLDFINLYNLIRLETNDTYRSLFESGFHSVRATTANHLNGLFNMVDRALHGPDKARDTETRADLKAWLLRPRTDVFVDWRGKVPECSGEACNPLPVADRPPSDFLWQLDPFQLYGGGSGTIETAGIDYILPYWMARYYKVIHAPSRRNPPRQ